MTKRIGSNEPEELTGNYKESEGSRAERDTLLRALRLSSSNFARFYLNVQFSDVRFELRAPDDIFIGQPLRATLFVSNLSDRLFTLNTLIAVRSSNTTQQLQVLLRKHSQQRKLSPHSGQLGPNFFLETLFNGFINFFRFKQFPEEQLVVELPYNEYAAHSKAEHSINISALSTILESSFTHMAFSQIRIRMPDIDLQVELRKLNGFHCDCRLIWIELNYFVQHQIEGDVIRGNPLFCRAFFTNPLSGKLTNGDFSVDGPGLIKPLRIRTKK